METYDLVIVKSIEREIKNGSNPEQLKDILNLSDEDYKEYTPLIQEIVSDYEMKRIVSECKSALIKRAKGYDYEETQKMGRRDKNGEAVLYVKTTTKHVPPSEQAIKMLIDMYGDK